MSEAVSEAGRLSIILAAQHGMNMELSVLRCGSCEPLKAGVHATALGLVAVMGLYNAAAWLKRRERHLAVNAVLYTVLTIWEHQHVAHHLAALRKVNGQQPATGETTAPVGRIAA
jgi:hypothetical protein